MTTLRSLVSVVAVLLLCFAIVPPSTQAQVAAPARGIEASEPTHQADFPKEVVFRLTARGDAEITQATLRVKQVGESTVTVVGVKVEPARAVNLSYSWDLQRYYVPPGVEVEYYWLLEDAQGRRLKTEPRTFALEDNRFPWRRLTDGSIEFNWYDGDERFAADLLAATRGALTQLGRDAAVPADLPIEVYVYANQRDLLSALRPTAQEWTGGQAFSDQGIVVAAIESSPDGLAFGRRVLPHEVSHVVISRLTENPYGGLPRWLDEGLAMYAEGSLDATYERALAQAIRDNRLFSVRSLSANFPSDAQAALLSYAQSYSLVKFLVTEHGRERLARLLAVFGEGTAYDAALESALGVDSDGLDAQWRRSVGAPPRTASDLPAERSAPLVDSSSAHWLYAAAGTLIAIALLSVLVAGASRLAARLIDRDRL